MEPTNSKTKKQNISDSEVDILSNLPDSVLSHILSFLPTTKQAVKTSILSKRWRYVWTSVDKLKFHNRKLPVVYKVLRHHQGNIKGFTLSGAREYNGFDVISCINTAISRGVERLHFNVIFKDKTPKWPLSIFSCKTLVDLKIWGLYKRIMDIPSTPIFPCLKKLELGCSDGEIFKGVVSRCPALEHLIVELFRSPPQFDIVSYSMKRLKIYCYRYGRIGRKIIFRVPSLEYLKISCALPCELIAEDQLSSLIKARARLSFLEHRSEKLNAKELRDSFVRFIQPISNVKFLGIKLHCDKFFNSVGHGVFVNLTKLEIVSSFFEWRLLLCFMESSINLEAISLTKMSTLKKHKLAWKDPKKVPTSLSSSLRKLSIRGYSEEELPMVKYVLRTAQILEQVDIHCAINYKDNMT